MTDTPPNQQLTDIAVQTLLDEGLPVETPVLDLEAVKLLGSRAVCDSLGLVSYLVALEERVNDTLGTGISLMSDRAMSQERSPFRNLAALVDFMEELISEEKNAR